MIIRNVKVLCEKLQVQVDRPEFHIESYIEKSSLDIISGKYVEEVQHTIDYMAK